MSHLMDYGPDWPPRTVSQREKVPPRRPRVFGRDFWLNAALLVGAFLIVAALAIVSDHQPQRVDFPISTTSTGDHR